MGIDRRHYYRESPARSMGALIGAGHIIDQVNSTRNRRLDCFACVHLVAGGGTFQAEGLPAREVVPGDLMLLFPGVLHSYGPHRPGSWTEWWLLFSGEVFTALVAGGLLSAQRPVWHPGTDPAFAAAFDGLVEDRRAITVDREHELAARTHLLLTRLHRADARAGAPASDLIGRACAALEQDLERPIDLDRLAKQLGLSYERFRKVFAASTGRPPARWRMERRIDRAKALLADGRLGIAAVAERLGYCDVYFFARQFRQVAGVTPGRFRREFLGMAEC